MTGIRAVAGAVARRNLRHAFTNPALLLPSLIFPLVFLVAFAGGLSNLSRVPGFHYAPGYTSFTFVFVFVQSAALGGVFSAFALAADFEHGFAQRLLVASAHRTGIVLGYVASASVRYAFTATFVTAAGLVAGMRIEGGAADVVALVALGLFINVGATLFAAGVALRARTLQAGPAMQIPIFIGLFLAPVYVPRHLLVGWVRSVSGLNPATAFLQAGRGFVSGVHETTGVAFACAGGLALILAVWAIRGLRRAEAAG